MSNLYQNKTIKNPSTDDLSQSQKGTAEFSSKNERFQYKIQGSPGPGSYEYKSGNFSMSTSHVNKERESPVKKEHQWIWENNRVSYLDTKVGSGSLGPGSYGIDAHEAVVSRTNWGKSERFEYAKTLGKVLPGPGSYENLGRHPSRSQPMSVFQSKAPRCFLSSCESEHSTSKILPQSPVKDFIQNPEILTNKTTEEKKKNEKYSLNSSVFASKIPRFIDSQDKKSDLGPGYYDVENYKNEHVAERLPRIITIRDQTVKKKISQPEMPGPGFYEVNEKTIKKSIQEKGNILAASSQPRFIEKNEANPGPGYYMRNKKSLTFQKEKSKEKMIREKASFNSSSLRPSPELSTKENPLGTYNIGYYDMQNKLNKHLEHIDKLKIMEVTLPAFNSKAKR